MHRADRFTWRSGSAKAPLDPTRFCSAAASSATLSKEHGTRGSRVDAVRIAVLRMSSTMTKIHRYRSIAMPVTFEVFTDYV
jgi:hypothetical protein